MTHKFGSRATFAANLIAWRRTTLSALIASSRSKPMATKAQDELLACPFCGSEQVTTAPSDAFGPTWWAGCKACAAGHDRETEAEAITAWNTRTGEPDEGVERPNAFELMQEFYLSRYYEPKPERPADNIQAAIEFTLDRAALQAMPDTALVERVKHLEEVLTWYRDEAEAAALAMASKPPNVNAATAIITALALDGGKRARSAIRSLEIKDVVGGGK